MGLIGCCLCMQNNLGGIFHTSPAWQTTASVKANSRETRGSFSSSQTARAPKSMSGNSRRRGVAEPSRRQQRPGRLAWKGSGEPAQKIRSLNPSLLRDSTTVGDIVLGLFGLLAKQGSSGQGLYLSQLSMAGKRGSIPLQLMSIRIRPFHSGKPLGTTEARNLCLARKGNS